MELVQRLQLAAQLAELQEDEGLPDALKVAAECRSWGITGELKPHQAEGVAWLIRRYVRGVNVILGDEMGLGKTLQAITLLLYIKTQRHVCGPFLILCPLSVTDGWASEFTQFAPELKFIRYIGSKEQREGIRRTICEHINRQRTRSQDTLNFPFEVLLTTYELAMLDVEFLSRFCWRYTIIDEAQRLKNSSGVLYKTLTAQYMMPRRLLLTGTPIQNNLSELWALLHLCMPLVFNDLEGFLSTFQPAAETQNVTGSNVRHNKQLELLKSVMHVFMLRRTKSALIQNKTLVLPSVSEVTIMAKMVQLQKEVYLSILKKEMPKLVAILSKRVPQMSLQNIVVQLRKACSHPYLFDGVEPEPFQEGEHIVQASGKLLVLDALLKNLYSEGHRVLIYSQMARTLDILQDYLEFRGYSYERLDGSVRAEERFAAVRSFSNATPSTSIASYATARDKERSEKPFVFLLTTRAGGVGLNLVAADTVIFYEQDWNPQADKQALQRAHRIGQTCPVLAINLVTENTVEEVILRRAKRKLQLTYDVIGCDDEDLQENGAASVMNTDLHSMIVFGLHRLEPSITEVNDKKLSDKDVMPRINDLVHKALKQRGEKRIDTGKDGASVLQELEENIYRFEGKDFSVKRREVTDQIEILEPSYQAAFDSWAKKMHDFSGNLEPDSSQARKRPSEAMNLEEIRAEKQRKAAERKNAKWDALGYKSLAVEDPIETPGDLSVTGDDGDVHFVFGDSTKPIKRQPQEAAIILSIVDDSGVWGHGGMFNALSQLSIKVRDAYVAARTAGDLHLGDLHLISVTEEVNDLQPTSETEEKASLWVSLAVVQTYDSRRKVPRSEISLPALETCLRKVTVSAARRNASVHMPRVASRPGQDRKEWYAVERLLRKYASNSGVHIFVYYFQRPNAI